MTSQIRYWPVVARIVAAGDFVDMSFETAARDESNAWQFFDVSRGLFQSRVGYAFLSVLRRFQFIFTEGPTPFNRHDIAICSFYGTTWVDISWLLDNVRILDCLYAKRLTTDLAFLDERLKLLAESGRLRVFFGRHWSMKMGRRAWTTSVPDGERGREWAEPTVAKSSSSNLIGFVRVRLCFCSQSNYVVWGPIKPRPLLRFQEISVAIHF